MRAFFVALQLVGLALIVAAAMLVSVALGCFAAGCALFAVGVVGERDA